ncbi:MAG: hypothetical protein ACJ76L_04415 [Conexibacter sp.]
MARSASTSPARERAQLAAAGSSSEWRSHTFQDGVRSLTLVGPLDAALAGRLWTRISELLERGCRRLIVDAGAIDLAGEQPALLAAIFAGRPASFHAVVVAPRGSALVDLLPASVGVALTLSDAYRQLRSGAVRRPARPRPAPAGRIPAVERHALSIRQSLRWAERAAHEGDYDRALAWLDTVERVEGCLGDEWRHARDMWIAAWAAQTHGSCRPRPGRR